jgi:hypothetical protein
MGEALSNRPLFSPRKMKASAAVLTREKQRTVHLENNLPDLTPQNQIKEEKHEQDTRDVKSDFSIGTNKITSNLWRSPSSLPHLIIEMKNEFLTHFYSRNYENKIEKWQGATSTQGSYI